MISQHLIEHFRRDVLDLFLSRERMVAKNMFNQERKIFQPFTQRRDMDRNNIDAIIKILPQRTTSQGKGEVDIRRRNDTHINLDFPISAKPLNFSLLEDSQELDLHRESNALDLVQKKRAVIRKLNFACTTVDGPREGSFFIAEEFALQKRVRKCAAVDGDKLATLSSA